MSAFLVGQKTLDLVALALHENGGVTSKERRFLMDMNARAMEARYGEDRVYEDIVEWRKRMHVPNANLGRKLLPKFLTPTTRAYLINTALRCFIYQCSEGTVPTLWAYRRIEKISEWLVDNHPDIRDVRDIERDIYDWGD